MPGTPLANTHENKYESLLRPSATAPRSSGSERDIEPNQATKSQIETTHQTSQRQVATHLTRNGEESRGGYPCSRAAAVGRRGSPPRVGGWYRDAGSTSLEGLTGAGVAYELEAGGRSRRCLRNDQVPFPVQEPLP